MKKFQIYKTNIRTSNIHNKKKHIVFSYVFRRNSAIFRVAINQHSKLYTV